MSANVLSERLERGDVLLRRADFQACYRGGRKIYGRLLNLHVLRNDHGGPRLGLTTTRRVGKAVVRNRLRRWARECYRRSRIRRRLDARDFVVHFKPAAGGASFKSVRDELEALLRRSLQSGRR